MSDAARSRALEEALRLADRAIARHDLWCGHYRAAPGDSSLNDYLRAREALVVVGRSQEQVSETAIDNLCWRLRNEVTTAINYDGFKERQNLKALLCEAADALSVGRSQEQEQDLGGGSAASEMSGRSGTPPLPTESNLPARMVGAYWRDFGDTYSMCPVSSDNDPVEVFAVYERVATANETPCADFPDVPVNAAVLLEVKLRDVLDEDDACGAVQVVLESGWRPAGVPPVPQEPGQDESPFEDPPLEEVERRMTDWRRRPLEQQQGGEG